MSNEEEYFYKANKELIERKRSELDPERQKRAARELQSLHWMKCPKCGNDLSEVDLTGVKVDKCPECRGVFFDHGELELLTESKEPKGFLMSLKGLFQNS